MAVDPRRRCIVACLGESAAGYEGDAIGPLLDRARFVVPDLVSVGADQGYAAERVYADLERRGIAAFIPPQPKMLPAGAPTSTSQRRALAARARTKSAEGIWAHARRMADAEGAIAELKLEGTLARARCRGTPLFHVQVLVDCAAVNCKRLVRHAGLAAGLAGAPALAGEAGGGSITRAVSEERPERPRAEREATRTPAIWSFSVCLN